MPVFRSDARIRRLAVATFLGLGIGWGALALPQAMAEDDLDAPINLIKPDEPPPLATVEEIQATQPEPELLDPLTDPAAQARDAVEPLIQELATQDPAVQGAELDDPAPASTDSDAEPGAAREQTVSADGIVIDALGGINPDAAGLLTEGQDGLPGTLWQGTDRVLVAKLLPRLARGAPSQTVRALSLRLLLSAGEPPAGDGTEGDLLRLRVRTLAEMGEYDVAAALLAAPPGFADPALAARVDAARMFRGLNFPAACSLAREQVVKHADRYWRKAVIFCQALQGDIEAALVGVDLMSEAGEPPGADFMAAIHTMAGGEPPELQTLSDTSPFQLAMLRAAGMAAPENIVASSNPAVLAIVAESSDARVETRLFAAERAEGLGALPAGRVAALYADVEFAEEHLSDPLAAAEQLAPPLARALLYQMVDAQRVLVARGEAVSAALGIAASDGRLGVMARALLPEIHAIEPQPLFAWFAVPAARGLIAAGDIAGAQKWYALALRQVAVSPDAAKATIELWPLVQMADESGELDGVMLNAWWEQQGGDASPDAHLRGASLMSLLAALGHDIPSHYWHAMLGGPTSSPAMVPSPAIGNLLEVAATEGRVGAVALLGLVALGEQGPGAAGVSTVTRVVQAFRAVGLDVEARALALEAALAEGF